MATRYTDEQKALALELVARNDGVLDVVTMDAIRAALETPSLPDQTVRLWMRSYQALQSRSESRVKLTEKKVVDSASAITVFNDTAFRDEDRQAVQGEVSTKLDAMFERAARMMVAKATEPEKINDMNGQQLMTAAGIAVDKMRLLRDMPTEIIQMSPILIQINQYAVLLNLSTSELLTKLLDNLVALKQEVQA